MCAFGRLDLMSVSVYRVSASHRHSRDDSLLVTVVLKPDPSWQKIGQLTAANH